MKVVIVQRGQQVILRQQHQVKEMQVERVFLVVDLQEEVVVVRVQLEEMQVVLHLRHMVRVQEQHLAVMVASEVIQQI
jgi:hypothetical protein